jgi:hypothetical protein
MMFLRDLRISYFRLPKRILLSITTYLQSLKGAFRRTVLLILRLILLTGPERRQRSGDYLVLENQIGEENGIIVGKANR